MVQMCCQHHFLPTLRSCLQVAMPVIQMKTQLRSAAERQTADRLRTGDPSCPRCGYYSTSSCKLSHSLQLTLRLHMKHGFAAAAMRLIKLKISQCWPHRDDASWV